MIVSRRNKQFLGELFLLRCHVGDALAQTSASYGYEEEKKCCCCGCCACCNSSSIAVTYVVYLVATVALILFALYDTGYLKTS
mmetsp:Transcript_19915/g.55958  ORF Transcript_19915/g.55958 Transcript_19915/m.55958 type:complete len:83 (+) Transcript_19915:268-516(+)